jgi:hypothetical protein
MSHLFALISNIKIVERELGVRDKICLDSSVCVAAFCPFFSSCCSTMYHIHHCTCSLYGGLYQCPSVSDYNWNVKRHKERAGRRENGAASATPSRRDSCALFQCLQTRRSAFNVLIATERPHTKALWRELEHVNGTQVRRTPSEDV